MDKESVEDTQEPESFQEVAKKKEEKKVEKKVDEEDNIQSLIVTQSETTSGSEVTGDNELEETSAATVESD